MSKKKVYFIVFGIFILAFFAGNLIYPQLLKLPKFSEVPFKLGLDLQGGTHLIYEADLSQVEEEDYTSSMQGLRDIIEKRVNLFGVEEPVVQTQETAGSYKLIVELAGIKDPAEAIEMIGQTPYLEFMKERPAEEIEKIQEKRKEIEGKTVEGMQTIEDWGLAFEDVYEPTELTGKYLEKAEVGFDQTTSRPLILLQFNSEGAELFETITTENVGKILAIYIDGMPISAPMVQEPISGGKAQITGDFTLEEARTLARNLNAGALPVPITLISQQSVGPTLGALSLKESLKAGIIGFLAVIVFMVLFYRLPGLLASLALIIYIAFLLSLFKIIPVTLTLAGIGGFILSIGMAVDANVLIFARMKEELKAGKSFGQVVEEGFNRAWPSIRDGNLTTLIVAAILFSFGTSFIKGFALTLSLGIIISMFSAIVITKNFLKCFINTKLGKIKWLWG